MESCTLLLGKLASPIHHSIQLIPKGNPHGQGSSQGGQAGAPKATRVGTTETGRKWACGLGPTGRRPGSNKAAGSPYLERERRAAPRGSRSSPDPATPSPRGPSPGRGTTAAPPSTPANSAPSGQWGSLPRLQAGRYKGREARPGTEPGVGKVKAEEGEGTGEDGGGRGSPRAVPPASGRCPQPRSGGRGGNADQQPFNPRPRGSAHKEERDPPPPPGRRRPDALLQPTVSGAGPARVPRGPGAGVRAGRPLSRTHPQLRAPAHGGTRSDSGRLAAPLSVRLLCRQSARPPTG